MRITVHVAGKTYNVEILKHPFDNEMHTFLVDGEPQNIKVSRDWHRQFSKNLILDNKSYQVEFEHDIQSLPTRVRAVGQAVDVKVDFPGKGKLKRPELVGLWGEGNQVRAPLPGKVIGVRVRRGQAVQAGEVLCLLEAMKMENELASHRAGIIKEVLVKEGDSVELDQVLINLE